MNPYDLNDEQINNEATQPNNQPPALGRRRFIKRSALALLGLTTLAACGDTTATSLPEATTEAVKAASTAPAAPLATATPVATPTISFTPTAAPTPTPKFESIKFGVLGDMRTEGAKPPKVAYQLIDLLKAEKPQAVILVGDMINALTTAPEVRDQWANLTDAIASLAPAFILPTVGNHETNGLKSVLPYYVEAFPKLPQNGPDGYKALTYSKNVGEVHFVSITSEHPTRFHYLGQDQLDWLEQDLKANTKPYTILFSHDPAYPVGPHVGSSLDAYPKDRDQMWKIMQTYKVNAYIAGHEHLYNRNQKGGLTHLIIGASGSAIYGGYGGEFYHYGLFEVTPQGINAKIVDIQGKTRDTFTLL